MTTTNDTRITRITFIDSELYEANLDTEADAENTCLDCDEPVGPNALKVSVLGDSDYLGHMCQSCAGIIAAGE